MNRISDILRPTDLDDIDRLSVILGRNCETERDRSLANEALSLLAEHRAVALHYLTSSADMRH